MIPTKDELVESYQRLGSQRAVALEFDTNQQLIGRLMRKYELKSRVRSDWSSGWKGGRILRKSGYVDIHISLVEPEFRSMTHHSGRYVFEHRLVIARSLERALDREESVHHLNGNKSDNRFENLLLMPRSKHSPYIQIKEVQSRVRELEAKIRKLERKIEDPQSQ